jgi:hypothetical protein
MVVVVAQVVTARVLLVETVSWVGTVGVVSLPLVRSYGGDGAASVQEPDMDEPSVEVLYVEEPSGFWQGRVGSSGELKPRLCW